MAIERLISRAHTECLVAQGWAMLEMPYTASYAALHSALKCKSVPGTFGIITELVFSEAAEWFTIKTVWFSDPNAAFEFKLKHY